MTGEGTRKDTEQTPNPLNCQADALPIELQPHAREADGRKSVVPSLATPTSYNKHRPNTPDRSLDGTYARTLADFEPEAPTPETHPQLVRIDEARQALAQVATVDDARKIVDVAEAMRVYAKKAHLGLEAQNYAAEIKMLAERRCGELLRDMAEKGERATHETARSSSTLQLDTLDDLGIEKTQSSRWQKVAAVPEAEFERYIADKKDSGQEVTTAGLLAHAGIWRKLWRRYARRYDARQPLFSVEVVSGGGGALLPPGISATGAGQCCGELGGVGSRGGYH